MSKNPLAGKPAQAGPLVDVPRLVTAYFSEMPDVAVPEQRVAFGTSGHRGSSLTRTFNEGHVLAITQAMETITTNDAPRRLGGLGAATYRGCCSE